MALNKIFLLVFVFSSLVQAKGEEFEKVVFTRYISLLTTIANSDDEVDLSERALTEVCLFGFNCYFSLEENGNESVESKIFRNLLSKLDEAEVKLFIKDFHSAALGFDELPSSKKFVDRFEFTGFDREVGEEFYKVLSSGDFNLMFEFFWPEVD